LETQLATLENDIDIAYEGDAEYTPKAGTPFLRSWHIPNDSVKSSIGIHGFIKHMGIYQVNCHYPTGQGFGPAYAKADELLALFVNGTTLFNNGQRVVVSMASAGTATIEDGWYVVPVSISYFSYEVM